MSKSFDVVVIGGGPGGYIAAIRAAQLGLATACIDEWQGTDGKPALGGTCTNVGCIPSKALLQSSENYEHAGHAFTEHGIQVKGLSLDLVRMLKRKDRVVRQNNDGIVYLFKKNKVAFFHGRGSLAGGGANAWQVKVTGGANEAIAAQHVIIATGSNPRPLPGAAFDSQLVLDNAGALALPEVPRRLGVIGAGVIGLELGSVWRRLGAEVTMLEMLEAFLPAADEAVAKEAWKIFTREQGLNIVLGANIARVSLTRKGVSVEYSTKGGGEHKLECDRLIVSIGRVPNTQGLGAQAAASSSISGASSRSMRNAAPAFPACGRSATWCAAPCSRTRPRRRASRSPSASPAATATWISTPSPGSFTPPPRLPGSARPSSS